MAYLLEVIAFNINSCQMAEKAGAHRIELCDNPGEGGTTPSYGMIKAARQKTGIPLFPIIRPRGGDFLYSDTEFDIIQDDIQQCKQLGCDGIVTGLLLPNGEIDIPRMSKLVALAYPMEVTFHRAFDRCRDAAEGLEAVISTGCTRILTSGGKPDAIAGAATIAALVNQADGRIVIMPGSGVRSSNLAQLIETTGATEFHSSARKMTGSNMEYLQPSMNEHLQTVSLDETEVLAMAAYLSQHIQP